MGVLLTTVLYVSSSASDVRVRALVPLGDGRFSEADPPARLPGRAITVLDVYGSRFFAGARTLGEALPDPDGADRPAVVLRLRGRTRVGATLIDVLSDYARELAEAGGRLYLTGVSAEAGAQFRSSGKLDGGVVQVVPVDRVLGASTERAISLAREWLSR